MSTRSGRFSLLCASIGALFANASWAAPAPSAPDDATNRLRETISYLASPELGGRAAGTPGHDKARKYVSDQLKRLGYRPEEQVSPSPVGITKGKIHNLMAVLPAEKHPGKRCVALAAHYDHNPHMDGKYSPGANDNASGVAVLLEIARRARTFHKTWDYDLYFLFPDQEENFISGSPPAVRAIGRKCEQVMFSLTLDVVGAPFFPGFEKKLLVLGGESSRDLNAMLEKTSSQINQPAFTAMNGPIFLIEPAGIPRSDYKAFRGAKIPFAFLTAGIPAEYHTPMDTIDKIDFPFVAKVADYVQSVLTTGLESHWPSRFEFEPNPEFDRKATTSKLAEIIELMLSKKVENGLTEKETEAFAKRIAKLRQDPTDATKLALQLDVIGVLKVVARKSPISDAYLKSVLGKVFN